MGNRARSFYLSRGSSRKWKLIVGLNDCLVLVRTQTLLADEDIDKHSEDVDIGKLLQKNI